MSDVATARANIKALLAALPGIIAVPAIIADPGHSPPIVGVPGVPAIPVKDAARVVDVFELNASRLTTIYVVYDGFARQGDQLVGNHGAVTGGKEGWSLVVVADDRTSAIAATAKAETVAQALLAVRGTSYSPTATPRYLVFTSRRPIESQDRTARGGALGFECRFESSSFRL
jgi:hypothetical protein